MTERSKSFRVFKFGGASVKDAPALRNLASILSSCKGQSLVIVVSAMGKTTNALEQLIALRTAKDDAFHEAFHKLKQYHSDIIEALFPRSAHPVREEAEALFSSLWTALHSLEMDKQAYYDQVVVFGELLSTCIVRHFLVLEGIEVQWLDARDYVITDKQFMNATVDWDETERRIGALKPSAEQGVTLLTQGFIGSAGKGLSTTLGREGSDYTAAIFAWCLDALDVVIWKDVPGLLNADPKRFDKVVKLEQISYGEAIELAYYGATIIHPKTLKPLQNKKIPLKVQSFHDPRLPPSLISEQTSFDPLIPSVIVKDNQVLVSISPRDFSFMNENNLHKLFSLFDEINLSIHLMQTSALSLSVCTDQSEEKLNILFQKLAPRFVMKYNTGLHLLTIRHYNQSMIDKLTEGREILLEQRSRVTAQYVIR
jgi:aspartate kinase